MTDVPSAYPPAMWGVMTAGAAPVGAVVVCRVRSEFLDRTIGEGGDDDPPAGALIRDTGSPALGEAQGAGRKALPQGAAASHTLPLPLAEGPLAPRLSAATAG
ncbi:hypothetical protein AAIB33_17345 [Microbacterium sp. AZCO]|uniref:hypothetical protein n=1 Tax=Microbacterium sp. AZCO TaxID=3142976 RepID=UPI0031F46170